MQMKAAVTDADGEEALRILKKFIKQIEQHKRSGDEIAPGRVDTYSLAERKMKCGRTN